MFLKNRIYMYNQIRKQCPMRTGPDKEYCSVLSLDGNSFNPLKARDCVKNACDKCPMFIYMELFIEQIKPQMGWD